MSEVAPQLLQALDVEKIAAVQFLKNSQVRVTCKTAEYLDDLLEGSTFFFGDVPIPVTSADQPIRSVFVRGLPFEVPDCDVKSLFESFGVVLSVHQCFFRDFLSVANGARRLVMSFRGSIPSSVSVADFPVPVFHSGQPVICSICHESGHLPQDCPFPGLCLRCKQPYYINITFAEVHVKRSVIFTDSLGPDILSAFWTKGQVLHRERAHLKVPGFSIVLNVLLNRKLTTFLSRLNEISGGCEKMHQFQDHFAVF